MNLGKFLRCEYERLDSTLCSRSIELQWCHMSSICGKSLNISEAYHTFGQTTILMQYLFALDFGCLNFANFLLSF